MSTEIVNWWSMNQALKHIPFSVSDGPNPCPPLKVWKGNGKQKILLICFIRCTVGVLSPIHSSRTGIFHKVDRLQTTLFVLFIHTMVPSGVGRRRMWIFFESDRITIFLTVKRSLTFSTSFIYLLWTKSRALSHTSTSFGWENNNRAPLII